MENISLYKPCPFCGKNEDGRQYVSADYEGAMFGLWSVRCFCGGKSTYAEEAEDAIKAWNTRTPPTT